MKVDIAIAGGGLAGALIAWRLRAKRPDVSIAVVERGETLGGNHTWSFHDSDLPAATAEWIAPIIAHQWPRQEVRFPTHRRLLRTGYRSTTSELLHQTVAPMLGDGLLCSVGVEAISKSEIITSDDRAIAASAIIDARGQTPESALTIGFQKFLGQELKFDKPHGLSAPIIMDATVSQSDGYRFIYVLPFSDDTALVEDTYYSDGAHLKRDVVRAEIADYCKAAGWNIESVIREEDGVLPIALAGDIEAHLDAFTDGVSQAGLRAGLFHPLTGYSLPDAALLAEMIADAPDLSGAAIFALTRNHAVRQWRSRAFYRMLSRFLYYAAKPEGRYKVLGRFYRLSEPLIERFYAGGSTRRDKMRVLVGKPPVSFFKAVECVDETRWLDKCWRPHVAAQ